MIVAVTEGTPPLAQNKLAVVQHPPDIGPRAALNLLRHGWQDVGLGDARCKDHSMVTSCGRTVPSYRTSADLAGT